ncbi:uncharacterized protein [Cherax quadricarinatus]
MGGREWAGGVDGLVEAVRKGHPRHIQLLLEAGVPVDATDDSGSTALVAAVQRTQDARLQERLLRLLLNAGADTNVGDAQGTTPLMHAAINNANNAAIILLQHEEVDPGVQDEDGNSALMYAAAFGHREIVLLILAAFKQLHHVAFQGQRNGQGLTAWQLAEKNGHQDIAALLKVESGVFPRPSGPSAFVPTHPLDLDRPPTPTETKRERSSVRHSKTLGRATVPETGPGPTDPLPPPSFITYCSDCNKIVPPSKPRTSRVDGDGSLKREKGRRFCVCSDDQDSEEDSSTSEGHEASDIRDYQSIRTLSLEASDNPNSKGVIGLITGPKSKGAARHHSSHNVKGAILLSSSLANKGHNSSHNIRGAILLSSGLASKGETGLSGGSTNKSETLVSSSLVSKGATRLNSSLTSKGATVLNSTHTGIVKGTTRTTGVIPLEDDTDSLSKGVTDEDSDSSTKNLKVDRIGFRSIPNWTKDIGNGEKSRSDKGAEAGQETTWGKRPQLRSEPVRVAAPDAEERRLLEELMQGLSVSGSPGSGNEADTESLMECEKQQVSDSETKLGARMSTSNVRKITVTAVATQPMPKIELSSSTRSLNRSIQHLMQEDAENRPEHRPPTPARPSLPTLMPGRLLDVSFSASMSSVKSEGRNVPPARKANFSAFPRSSSEPRSLTSSPRPDDDDNDDDDEPEADTSTDLLDSSTRSEGWDHLRGAKGRGPSFSTSEGHVVPLPPINRPRYNDMGLRGRGNTRGRSGVAGCEENVLSVAKKTLEQLETVLAPKETPAFPRSIPRTRATHQIHLET